VITEAIGDGFLDDAQKLTALVPFAQDSAFLDKGRRGQAQPTRWRSPPMCANSWACPLDPDALFDVQIKRIHEI
jgi:starch phosphorylase